MSTRPLVVALVGLALVAPSVGAVPLGGTAGTAVDSVTYRGQSVAVGSDGPLHIWRSDRHEFEVQTTSTNGVRDAGVCLLSNGTGGPHELACRNVTLAAGETRTVSLAVTEWPMDLTGPRTLGAVVRNRTAGDRVASAVERVVVLTRSGDSDGDGLTNEREVTVGTDLSDADTDGDGLGDGAERETYGTSATEADTDADGLDDRAEIEIYHSDPARAETDGDGLSDGREVDLGTVPTRADTDGDGLDDGGELTTYQTNATRLDTDGDGLGDGGEVNRHETDPTGLDTDGDGLDDGREVTLHGTDPARVDTDGDGLSDFVEVTEQRTDPTREDTDGDSLTDGDENATHGTGPLAVDTDGDGLDDGDELRFGSDPTDPTSRAQPGLVARAAGAATETAVVAAALAFLGGVVVTLLAGRLGLPAVVGVVARLAPERAPGGSGDADDTGDGTEREHDPDGAGRDTGTTSDDGAASDSPVAPPTTEEDVSIMTNEERVVHLLDRNDGRMLQSDMVEAADWSKATVSRVLSRMEEDDAVSRVDIGKGNLVTRPGDEPRNAESPFSR